MHYPKAIQSYLIHIMPFKSFGNRVLQSGFRHFVISSKPVGRISEILVSVNINQFCFDILFVAQRKKNILCHNLGS